MAQERGRALVAATAVVMMVTMSMLFHYQVAEAAKRQRPPIFTPVTWNTSNVFKRYPNGLTLPKGRTLVFNYKNGAHDVMEVNEADFNKCKGVHGKPFTFEGEILKAGLHYFVCSFPGHCRKYGMKIKVNAK